MQRNYHKLLLPFSRDRIGCNTVSCFGRAFVMCLILCIYIKEDIIKEIHFPWEAGGGKVYINHQFLRDVTAQFQTASQTSDRLSFNMIVPEEPGC